ncbi:MAG: serine/threonine protein kinase, partial [Acidobacteriota bacterium]
MGTSETLRSVIDAGKSSKRLDELSTARVVGKIAEQLHAAQQKAGSGKSVGPITPAAIAIDAAGAVKIDLSQRGSALGYSSPEQLNGAAGDRRSDVFSLGVVMWEALTHQRLFEAMSDAAVKLAVNEREIKPPAEMNANIPAELSAMCMKALARNPADRYQSAKVMSVEIDEFLSEAGYEDSVAPLVGFLADMKKAPRPTLLPPSILKSMPPAEEPAAGKDKPREKEKSDTKPLPAGLALASALAKAETKPVEAVARVPEPPKVPDPPKLPEAAKHQPAAAAPSSLASSLPPIENVAAFAPPVEPARPAKATIAA